MKSPFWPPFLVCLVLTPFAVLAAMASGGAGHGDYTIAVPLFPYTFVLAHLTSAESILIPATLVQFPIYGVILGLANRSNRLRHGVIILLVFHLATLAASLVGYYWGR